MPLDSNDIAHISREMEVEFTDLIGGLILAATDAPALARVVNRLVHLRERTTAITEAADEGILPGPWPYRSGPRPVNGLDGWAVPTVYVGEAACDDDGGPMDSDGETYVGALVEGWKPVKGGDE